MCPSARFSAFFRVCFRCFSCMPRRLGLKLGGCTVVMSTLYIPTKFQPQPPRHRRERSKANLKIMLKTAQNCTKSSILAFFFDQTGFLRSQNVRWSEYGLFYDAYGRYRPFGSGNIEKKLPNRRFWSFSVRNGATMAEILTTHR